MKKILILSEGGLKIGFGHIARCSALYEAFEEEGIRPLLVVNGDSSVRALLKGKKIKIFNWLKNQKKLFALISGAEIAVIDSYMAGPGFYKRVSGVVKTPVYVDDNKRLSYPRGLVVNGSIYAEKLNYPRKTGNAYMLGAEYMPLRREFRVSPDKKIKRSVKNILITFGGDDARSMTERALKFLTVRYSQLNKTVIMGKGFKNIAEIERLKDGRTELIYYPNASEVKSAMLKADIAISAGGQTLYELARIGVPTAAIAVAENQLNNIKAWRDAGFIDYAGWYKSQRLDSGLSKCVSRLMRYSARLKRSEAGRSRIDGKGSSRIIHEILEPSIGLRKAVKGDSFDIFSWRNHPDVRMQSFDGGKINYAEHVRWFSKKLRDRKTKIYIAEAIGAAKIGQIRFDAITPGKARVNVNLNPAFIGRGFGSKVIAVGTHLFLKDSPAVKVVIAEIFCANTASRRAFHKAGYIFSRGIVRGGKKSCEYKFER